MTLPAVTITEIDGQLGVLPAGMKAFAVVGPCDAGPLNTPAAFGRTTDIVSTFVAGPAVEAACHLIKVTGKPVVMVRTAASTVATHTDLVVTGVTGTSVVTLTPGDLTPNDDYEPYFKVVTGGTLGVAGITYQYSLDGGRTLSPVTALGVAVAFVFPNAGGIGYSFAAGTLNASDVVTSLAKAPAFTGAEITTALNALMLSATPWEAAVLVGPLDDTIFDAAELAFASKPEKWFIGQFRMPTAAESEATYLTAFNTAFSGDATTHGAVCAGACDLSSAVSGRKYRRPSLFSIAAELYRASEEEDIAKPSRGALPGVSIRDANGNPKHHDESISPGLDDARACTLRTIEDERGVYVTNPRLLSAAGSDFEFIQHRRVMSLARAALRSYFTFRLSLEVLVDRTTGYLTDETREEMNVGATRAMANVLLAKPKASDCFAVLSATDNVLSTKTINVGAFVTPLAYIKQFAIQQGFRNPALQITAV
jgi:hypothetical protein